MGRKITNNSKLAQYKREWMRRQRARDKNKPAPVEVKELAQALNNWGKQ